MFRDVMMVMLTWREIKISNRSQWHIHDCLKGNTKFQTLYEKKILRDVRLKCDGIVLWLLEGE